MTICPGTVLLVFMVSLHLHNYQKQQSSTSYNYHWEHCDHADMYHHWSIDQYQSMIIIIILPAWSLIIVVEDDHLHFLPQVSLWIIASWTLRQCERYQFSNDNAYTQIQIQIQKSKFKVWMNWWKVAHVFNQRLCWCTQSNNPFVTSIFVFNFFGAFLSFKVYL